MNNPKRIRHHRTPEREIQAFKRRIVELERKEARCPGCQKIRKLAEQYNLQNTGFLVCPAHQRIRFNMAF